LRQKVKGSRGSRESVGGVSPQAGIRRAKSLQRLAARRAKVFSEREEPKATGTDLKANLTARALGR